MDARSRPGSKSTAHRGSLQGAAAFAALLLALLALGSLGYEAAQVLSHQQSPTAAAAATKSNGDRQPILRPWALMRRQLSTGVDIGGAAASLQLARWHWWQQQAHQSAANASLVQTAVQDASSLEQSVVQPCSRCRLQQQRRQQRRVHQRRSKQRRRLTAFKPMDGEYKPPGEGVYEPPVVRAPIPEHEGGRVYVHVHSAFRKRRRRSDHQPVRLLSDHQPGYVALCLTIKDQHEDIIEWVDWHVSLGVDRVYIFDTGSDPPLNTTLHHHIRAGQVEYHYVLNVTHYTGKAQMQVADTCLNEFRERHRWIGFIDSDEFLVLRDPQQDLPSLLKEYEAFGALAVNWRILGTSNHTERQQSVLRSFTACMGPDAVQSRTVKIIANTQYTAHPWKDPHTFKYINDTNTAVDEAFNRINYAQTLEHRSQRILIHHYATKSWADVEAKIARGSAMGNHKPRSWFEAIDRLCTHDCSYVREALLAEEAAQHQAAAAAVARLDHVPQEQQQQ